MTVYTESLKKTPLFSQHEQMGAKCAPFGGWLMPIQYTGIIDEHQWTRTQCSIFDVCHMGEFIIRGDPDSTNLNRILTTKLNGMKQGRCRYGFMLNEQGGILDDVIICKISEDQWMLVVNAATTESDAAHLRKHLASEAVFEDISATTSKIDIQGPQSRQVIRALFDSRVEELPFYAFGRFSFAGCPCTVSRSGYTGELGFEIYIDNDKANELWQTLLSDSRVHPAGLGARDTLRLEVCYPLYGQDIDSTLTPLEAGLGRVVDFEKDFIGKPVLKKQKEEGCDRVLCSFVASSRRAPRHNHKIFAQDREVGRVTSGTFSPSLECGIGMGYVSAECAQAGKKLQAGDERTRIDLTVREKPLYKNGTARQ